ncbi:MAG: Argonaute siRNA chaperone complex subunit Arb1-domain-containing protein [Linnemannia gamsii]|nr:MAG: Argonaute siRNA chaperone complex subunit Arb1-domain-containing protein [Linnemannia gamsii]
MDTSQMTDEQLRETVAKMFEEMGRTLNAVGDYPDSESEYETGTDNEDEDNNHNKTNGSTTTTTMAENANCNATSSNGTTINNANVNSNSNSSNASINGNDSDAPSKKSTNGTVEGQDDPDVEKISMSYTQPPPGSTTTANGETNEPEKKKKRKKKSKKAKIELEDYLAAEDGIDPQADNPYDKSKTPAERVEIAVTRFRKNRKFSNIRSQILSVYLDYGGIQTGPKMFQGGGAKTGGANDDGEVDFEAMSAGIDRVDLPEEGQEVDFTNVVTTFLSQHFLKCTGWIDMVYYKDTPIVVAALLNYLLIRDVLPEYKEDLEAALVVAEKAKVELPLCKMISSGLPSRYDRACSLLYGGEWFNYFEDRWQGEAASVEILGLDYAMAKKIVKSVVGPNVDPDSLRVAPREFLEMEIVHVPAIDLGMVDTDTTTPEEEEDDAVHIFFDPNVASKLLLGMRIAGYVYTLSNGMSYLEQAFVMPTYYMEADEIEQPEDEWED